MSTASRSDAGAAARPRERRPTVVDESWFGAFGATGDSPPLIEDSRFVLEVVLNRSPSV